MRDPLLLATGEIVVPVTRRGEGFYSAKVLWAPASSRYPAGGHDITLSPGDIYRARTVVITDSTAANLITDSTPNLIAGRLEAGQNYSHVSDDNPTGKVERHTFTIVTVRGSEVDVKRDDSDETMTLPFKTVESQILLDNFTSRLNRSSEVPA